MRYLGLRFLFLTVLLVQTALSGCVGLVIREDDNAAVITGKVVARTLLALPTLGLSEFSISGKKLQEEARPLPITTGFHTPHYGTYKIPPEKVPFVVWGNHPTAVSRVSEFLQRDGYPIVERSRLNAIFDKQKIRLSQTPEDMSALLQVGKMVGAARITYVEFQRNSETPRGTAAPLGVVAPIGGITPAMPPASQNSLTLGQVGVTVRTVNVEDGTIRWTGTATSNKPVANPEAAMAWLTQAAISRALCPFEKGYRWIEAAPWRKNWGCLPPG
jgi:hypothetical protein